MKAPTNSDDIIDSRAVIERLGELQDERDALQEAVEAAAETVQDSDDAHPSNAALDDAHEALEYWETDNLDEFNALRALDSDGSAPDWKHGVTLIRDSYFEEYAREQASEFDALHCPVWPFTCIDWEKAADELKQDYTSVEFDGVTYWVRS